MSELLSRDPKNEGKPGKPEEQKDVPLPVVSVAYLVKKGHVTQEEANAAGYSRADFEDAPSPKPGT